MTSGREKAALTAKGRSRRQHVVDTTFDLIAPTTDEPPSLRAIGRATGMETSHLLHYFGSREALLQAVLVSWNDRFRERDAGQSWIRRLPSTMRHNTTVPGIVRLYLQLLASAADPAHPSAEFFRQRFERIVRAQSEEILALQARGTVPADVDAQVLPTRIISLSDGLHLRWLVDPDLDMAAEMTSALLDWLHVPDLESLQVDPDESDTPSP